MRMHSLWSDAEAKRLIDHYAAAGVGRDLALRVYTSRLLGGEPKLVPLRNITRLAQWPWLRLLYSSPNYRLYKIDYRSYYKWYPSHANDH